jgi:putative peptidoglycan lipid II flippase
MSVAAAELPAMAVAGGGDGAAALRQRLQDGLRRIAFFVVPSAIAFLAFGDVIAAALLQTGRFGPEDAVYVWGILAGSSLGLLASTLGRLYSSAYYALHDTRTPLAFAIVRIGFATVLGYVLAVHAPPALGISRVWGAAGLTVSASAAGWIELLLLRRSLNARIGATGLPLVYVVTLWLLGIGAAAAGWGVRLVLPPLHPALAAAAVLGSFGMLYTGGALLRGIPEATAMLARLGRRRVRL